MVKNSYSDVEKEAVFRPFSFTSPNWIFLTCSFAQYVIARTIPWLVFLVLYAGPFLCSTACGQAEAVKEIKRFKPPVAVGASEREANLVFWFVMSDFDSVEEPSWSEHKELLELMEANSIRARVEHYFTSQFDERWRSASQEGCLPNFLVSESSQHFRGLMADGVVRDVISTRLKQPDATSSCRDFRFARIWQVLDAAHPEPAERAVSTLLAPRPDGLLGPVVELNRVERVLLTTKVKQHAKIWFQYNFDELDKHLHQQSPQRFIAKSMTQEDLDWVEAERRYRDSTQFRKVQFYGSTDLIIAMIDTVSQTEPREDGPGFLSKSSINQSPTCVMLAKEKGEYRALLVGTWQYEITLDESTAKSLLSFSKAKPLALGETPSKPEILSPNDGAKFGEVAFDVRWKCSEINPERDKLFFVQRYSLGQVNIQQMAAEEEIKASFNGESELAIWNISSNAPVEFSKAVHLRYDPDFAPK